MAKTMFIIKDWAGNIKFKGKLFKSFDSAWETIYSSISKDASDEEFDSFCEDFYVEEV